MNRERFYALRRHIRSSGYSWNGGERVAPYQSTPMGYIPVGKTKEIDLVIQTMLHTNYDKFEQVRPLHELIKRRSIAGKDSRIALTRVHWQNIMRSNVRHDNRVFTEQLTFY